MQGYTENTFVLYLESSMIELVYTSPVIPDLHAHVSYTAMNQRWWTCALTVICTMMIPGPNSKTEQCAPDVLIS